MTVKAWCGHVKIRVGSGDRFNDEEPSNTKYGSRGDNVTHHERVVLRKKRSK